MEYKNYFETRNGNYYLYLPSEYTFHLLPESCMPYWTGEKEPDDSYESRKVAFFQQLLKREAKEEFITEYSPIKLKKNLANLNHLLIEVTDGCNLACKYCGYGDLYGNYDKRENKNNTFQNVKLLVDYLQELWHSTENLSFNKVCYIGFYGGEPLINFPLIKETIDYLESLPSHNGMRFEYNMTTNAVLLHKYMDYIVEKRFHLLISLDGNEYNDSYRVAKNGKGSFQKVIANIGSLKEKYPDYFEQQVNFNAVLHNRNSVKDIISYIMEQFGKVPSIAPLSSNGIRKDKMQEFMNMFRNQVESYREAESCMDMKEVVESPDSSMANFFINSYCAQTFRKYGDLFVYEKDKKYIPTGTCMPLKRKLFLTVNGKILACERIGQEYTLGEIIDGKVCLDFDGISRFYKELFDKIIHLCKNCAMSKGCGMCIFHQNSITEKKINCAGYTPKRKLNEVFSEYLYYFENKREAFNKVINETIII